uniref:poly(A)-specific ribonuclease n=1 Tax=Kalanchoe fedtschenkoi TaxID=63787 RepID=A0A7N0VKF5_KALFE
MHIQIRRVGRRNCAAEAARIRHFICDTQFNVVSMDTEYPGTVYSSADPKDRHPAAQYALMKSNVDELALIQVGLTLSDVSGNLATLDNTNQVVVWEFAISDFDPHVHKYVPESIDMLKSRGLNLEFHKQEGIHSHEFAQMMVYTGLVQVPSSDTRVQPDKEVRWITFHGAYDFGYLIKALTRRNLPEKLQNFTELVRSYFGRHVYDIKIISRYCYDEATGKILCGGLDEIASKLGTCRILGDRHQAGSDSLVTF